MSSRNQRTSHRSILQYFMNNKDDSAIYHLRHNANVLAAQLRSGIRITSITGIVLMQQNVEIEVRRLNIQSQYLIRMATNRIWRNSTRSQRQQFIDLAHAA